MDAVEDADGEPGVLRGNFFEGVIMSHGEIHGVKNPRAQLRSLPMQASHAPPGWNTGADSFSLK
jgi:hypothetical protein